MTRSILLCAALLAAACGRGDDEPPANETGAAVPADTPALEGGPRIGAARVVQERVNQAEADMAERARQAEEQVRRAEGGAPPP